MKNEIFDLPPFEPGHVWLVGAGPGDPGLLTLLAVEALREADVVVYDALVNDQVLSLLKEGAELISAGKRGGRPSPRQPDISRRLVELAHEGKRVLRLKGGDPFVFGRGAEEAKALAEAGIPFRIVPGITAGIGGLAYAGIPATSRETNAAVTFVTGHSATGEVPDNLDWEALSKGSPVLVFYMGLKHLDLIVEKLLAVGRSADEPAAVVCEATTPNQRTVQATLGTLAAAVRLQGMTPPGIVVTGPVVACRDFLKWRPESRNSP